MPTFRNPVGNFTFESLLGFIGALLIFPLLFKLLLGTIKFIFGLRLTRKLILDALIVGLISTLRNESVLNRLFGQKGRLGDGLFKPEVNR